MSIHRLFQCGLKSPKYSNHRQKAIPYIAVFQSLRSLRTATPSGPTPPGTAAYFNPRSPCGPRPPPEQTAAMMAEFQSSRSLRTATIGSPGHPRANQFQSSRSLRTATSAQPQLVHLTALISILAVLADRDLGKAVLILLATLYFNPRGPCGPRPLTVL